MRSIDNWHNTDVPCVWKKPDTYDILEQLRQKKTSYQWAGSLFISLFAYWSWENSLMEVENHLCGFHRNSSTVAG